MQWCEKRRNPDWVQFYRNGQRLPSAETDAREGPRAGAVADSRCELADQFSCGQSDSKFMSRPPRALTTFRLNSKDGSAALPVSLDGSGKLTGY